MTPGMALSVAWRIWSVAQAPVTAAIVAALLPSDAQGVWFMLVAMARWQTFGDLGVGAVVQQFASHEASRLPDPLARGRLGALVRFAATWVLVAAPILVVVMVLSGLVGFDAAGLGATDARVWIGLAVLTVVQWGGNLVAMPIVEGRGRVAEAAGFRLGSGILGRLGAWGALAGGGGLWGLVVERAVGVVALVGWVLGRRGEWAVTWRDGAGVSMGRELAPLLWRTALGTLGGFLPDAVALPAVLVVLGAGEAGRIGLALSIFGGLGAVVEGAIQARVPQVAMRVAQGDRDGARTEFWGVAGKGIGLFVMGAVGFLVLVAGWQWLALPRGDRAPEPVLLALLAAGAAVRLARGQALVWARANKTEPFWPVEVGLGAVAMVALPLAASVSAEAFAGAWVLADVVAVVAMWGIGFIRRCR